jgi:hypothetical protein
VGFRAGDGACQFDAAGVKPPSAVVGWAYLAAFLAAVCIRVCFVERVDGLVSLEVFLKEFETGLPCDCARHGWGSVWGVWRVEEAPCPCYICFLAPHAGAADPPTSPPRACLGAGSEPKGRGRCLAASRLQDLLRTALHDTRRHASDRITCTGNCRDRSCARYVKRELTMKGPSVFPCSPPFRSPSVHLLFWFLQRFLAALHTL